MISCSTISFASNCVLCTSASNTNERGWSFAQNEGGGTSRASDQEGSIGFSIYEKKQDHMFVRTCLSIPLAYWLVWRAAHWQHGPSQWEDLFTFPRAFHLFCSEVQPGPWYICLDILVKCNRTENLVLQHGNMY